MASRIRDDVLYLVRALEGDLKVYEKQADLLFTLLNTLVASDTSNVLDRCISSHELNFSAVASRSSSLLSDQMSKTVASMEKNVAKLNKISKHADVFKLEFFVESTKDQMCLNHALLRAFLGKKTMANNIVPLSCILHQPLVPYTDINAFLSEIKLLA